MADTNADDRLTDEAKMSKRIGVKFNLKPKSAGHACGFGSGARPIFIGVGPERQRANIPGEDYGRSERSFIERIKDTRLGNSPIGRTVAVIGAGNTA